MINAAGKPMEETLTAMFNVCWDEGKLPERWGKARVRMLYKMGTKSDVGNYRGISLLSVLSKLYEKVCMNRLMAVMLQRTDGQGIQAEQLGFNPNNCGSDAIYGLVEGIKYSRNKGMYVVVASCDISKAYPKMHRGHMLNLARKAGAKDRLLQAIAATYDDNTSAILTSVKGVTSTAYPVKDGLREGAVLSPTLFNIYIAELFRELKATGVKEHGMHVGSEWAGGQAWADDVVLTTANKSLTEAVRSMKVLMKTTVGWADRYGATISTDISAGEKGKGKTVVMIVGNGPSKISTCQWPDKKRPMAREVASFKYLGVAINKALTWGLHVSDTVNKAKAKGQDVWPLARNRHMELAVTLGAWERKVPPCLLKGLVALRVTGKTIWDKLDLNITDGARRCLGLGKMASGEMACDMLEWLPAEARVHIQQSTYMWRLLHEAPERIRKMHRELTLQRGRCTERECTVPWYIEVEGRNRRWMGDDWREKCKYMTKKQWTGEVTAEAAVEYAEYWTDRIRSKAMAPVVQAAAPQEYVGKCVHKPGNHFATGADTDDRLYSGVIAAYNRARGEWAVKYDPGAPAYGEQYGHEDMREYGPKEYALDTHTNERRNNKVGYLQRRGIGVARFLPQPLDCVAKSTPCSGQQI